MGRLTLNVLLSFAQFEREVTGERIRDKIAASKRKGMWMGGVVPFGYDLQDRTLTVNEAEAEQVRTIYRLYLELGCVSKLQARLEQEGIRSKKRLSRTGRASGDLNFSRGSLYELLQNRLYLGEIRHKEQSYLGQHRAIVDRRTFERARQQLLANKAPEARHTKTQEVSWLAGKLFDTEGRRFTPTHTTKRGRRSRYYVPQVATQKREASRSTLRIPAREIEGLVLGKLERVVSSPQRLLDLISEDPENPQVMKAALIALSSSTPGRTERLIASVEKVFVGEENVTATIDREKLRQAVELEGRASGTIEISVDATWTRARCALRFQVPGQERLREQPAMVNAIARSRDWLDRLLRGDAKSQRDLAAQEGCDERYVSRLLPLAFLSPEITETVLDGRQPAHWTLNLLLGKVPLDWTEQSKLLAEL